jgi:hypothetical protein
MVMMSSPAAGWPRHDGVPGPADADYLVAPEPAIGAVLSAETNYSSTRSFYAMDSSFQKLVYEVVVICTALGWLGSVFAQAGGLSHVWPSSSRLGLGQKVVALGYVLRRDLLHKVERSSASLYPTRTLRSIRTRAGRKGGTYRYRPLLSRRVPQNGASVPSRRMTRRSSALRLDAKRSISGLERRLTE